MPHPLISQDRADAEMAHARAVADLYDDAARGDDLPRRQHHEKTAASERRSA